MTKLDKEKIQFIREITGTQNILKEIKQYQKKWLQHVQRMDTNRLPKQALQYKPNGRRNLGRPRKRWRDQLHLEDQGTGNTPKPSWTWWWWWKICIRKANESVRFNKMCRLLQLTPVYICVNVNGTNGQCLDTLRTNSKSRSLKWLKVI